MFKHVLMPGVAAIAAGIVFAAPAHAQSGALIIYGNDTCPANTICVRAPESERYRIPESLRAGPLAPADQPWRDRAASIANVGATGAGSCSATGAGGETGCWKQQMQSARAENKQAADAEAASPLPK